jgi:hypothetical protein
MDTTKTSNLNQNTQSRDRDFNLGPPEMEAIPFEHKVWFTCCFKEFKGPLILLHVKEVYGV